MRVGEGRKGWSLLAIKRKAVRTVVGRGVEEPSNPGSDVRSGREKEKQKGEENRSGESKIK